MVGTRLSLMVFAAPTAQSPQPPMTIALTALSLVNSPMLRSDSLGSDRLSFTISRIFRPPSSPESLTCSVLSSSARWYALPAAAEAPEISRSAAMMISPAVVVAAPN